MNQSEMLCDFATAGDFDCFLLAGRYTLLDQSALDRLLPLCLTRGIGIILGGPFNGGILASGPGEGAYYNYKPAPNSVQEQVQRLIGVCQRHSVSLQAAALQFPLGHPSICTVITGARSPTEARANARFFEESVPDALWEELREANLIREDAPTGKLRTDQTRQT
jgi:D-threo-aldose 1-dehydrogenase